MEGWLPLTSLGTPFFYQQRPSFSDTVGCVWNFQIGGGCKLTIFQYNRLKFDMVLHFGLINCPTVVKIFSCKKSVDMGSLVRDGDRVGEGWG